MNLMNNAVIQTPRPLNEPILDHAPGSPERAALKRALDEAASREIEVPLVIGGERVLTGRTGDMIMPHDHGHRLGVYHKAGPGEVQRAIDAAVAAQKDWQQFRWEERAAIFLKAAELLAVKYRAQMNAGSMLNGGKTVFQAEIDAACELIDFLRFNVAYAQQIYENQPESSPGVWNFVQYRPLEGFVFAVTPFNFTAIAGNLPTAPAIMGNTVVWKPASSLVYTPWLLMQILEEAGLPPGVINFVPGSGGDVGDTALASPHLAGVHFTGSTRVFQQMWQTIGGNIERYHSYPRIVGETGGKDFVFAHASADVPVLVTALVRGSFEYQGQKCSAASRAYIPRSLWPEVKASLESEIAKISMGPPTDFRNFFGAVIDRGAFDSIKEYIDYTRETAGAEVIIGGGCDDSVGYYIEPTVILAEDPKFRTMVEEIFGPVLCMIPYATVDEAVRVANDTEYGLSGYVWGGSAEEAMAIARRLRTGMVHLNGAPNDNQAPFGGYRQSGNGREWGELGLEEFLEVKSVYGYEEKSA